MPTTNGTIAAVIACLAPIVAAIVVLFKLNLTADQQAELVAGLAGVITVGGLVYASVVHTANAKVQVAQANLATAQIQNLPPDGDDSIVPPKAK